jgi:hypothetical protein
MVLATASIKKIKMRRTGLRNGLQLEIFLGENEIQPCFQTNRGLIITI